MSDSSQPPHEPAGGAATGVAVVGHDARGEPVVTACNAAFFLMTGATRADTPAFPVALATLVPAAALAELQAALAACLAEGAPQTLEQVYGTHAGAPRWRLTLTSLMPVTAVTRAGSGAAAIDVLITGERLGTPAEPKRDSADQAQRTLEMNEARYRAVVDSAYDAIVTIDQRHNITLFNRAAENLFGYAAADVLGQPIVMLLPERFRADHPRRVNNFADAYQPAVRQATPPRMDGSNSVYGLHRDGSIIPVEIAVSRIEVDGAYEFTAVVRDITDRAQLMAQLKKEAGTDALTGLPNRRAFLDFVARVFDTAGSAGALSVFMLDIDFFKKINDRHGHDAGDEVLRVLAKIGMSSLHESNLFARWGGEEFVAALPGADAALARQIADELRRHIEQQDFEHAWSLKPIPFTVSIGVVTREGDERDVDALMKRADRAMYRAKKSGRNRVESG
ncbi:sensor domain-containing diguanylate cyclase [Paraburkholderia acidisoli]|uniref:diguanylate cyclase n=1 Tax=Paraburkholderia acidisoli TaxID=2571748 RepID=A0A7Z2JIB4_9BURK|nr:diguanylate cyclase [Paraburkholderia acidisoli]QGZ65526.1 diguanylate cyclase [Paraburkholderia acidisoli]